MLQSLSNFWTGLKAWFKNSETIFLARTAVFGGIVYAGLMAVNWDNIAALNFADGISSSEMFEALKWIGLGLLTELARRRNSNL